MKTLGAAAALRYPESMFPDRAFVFRRLLAVALLAGAALVAGACGGLFRSHAPARAPEPPPTRIEGTLKRRGALGVQLTNAPLTLDDGTTVTLVRIQQVFPGTPADQAGLREGEVLREFNGEPVPDLPDFVRLIGETRDGDEVTLKLEDGGKAREAAVTLGPFRMEQAADYEIYYDDVNAGGWRQRIIVSKPKGNRPRPAVLFVQGLPCSSIDVPFEPEHYLRRMAAGFAAKDIVFVRLERSGVGDSEGPDCPEVDLETELHGYEAALEKIRAYPFVHPGRVFVFGHSLGGLYAPALAHRMPVAGVIVYGTVGKSWLEYLPGSFRREWDLSAVPPSGQDERIRRALLFDTLFYYGGMEPAAILEAHPELQPHADIVVSKDGKLWGRSHAFWEQIRDLRVGAGWESLTVPVLAMWGTSDYVTTREDQQWIAAAVNRANPDHARFTEIPGSDHVFHAWPTAEDSHRSFFAGPFHPGAVREVAKWINKQPRP